MENNKNTTKTSPIHVGAIINRPFFEGITKNNIKNTHGITLIALVVTIILLLILTGITISQLTGNGLFQKARLATEETKKSQIQEMIQLAVNDILIEYISEGREVTNAIVKEGLSNNKTLEGIIINNDLTGSYEGYEYYIDENYNVHIKGANNKPIIAKIEVKEEKRKISAIVTEAKEGIQRIEITDPSGNVISTQELDGIVTTGKIENCIANQSGNYKIKVTTKENKIQEKTINVNKIQISTKAELEEFRTMVNSGVTFAGDTVELIADIDLEGSKDNENWHSIGGSDTEMCFSGIFEGNNHKILNIYSKEMSVGRVGFFGYVIGGTVQNLKIESGNIIGHYTCGGIVGRIDDGNIINCYNKAKIEGGDASISAGAVGGIAGYAVDNTVIKMCYNSGDINGIYEGTGGIVGIADNGIQIESCYNTGDINSYILGAGIVGDIWRERSLVNNCYNTGNIIVDTKGAGGLIGKDDKQNEIKNSYSIGKVNGNSNVGGVIVEHYGILSNLFFINTAGPEWGCGVNDTQYGLEEAKGSTIETLKQLTNRLNETQNDIFWKEDTESINDGYPILSWQ